MSAGGRDTWLVLRPLDTVSVRDGRGFDAGTASTGRAVPPRPSTVAGAVGAAFGPTFGRVPETNPDEVRGPVVVRRVRPGGRASPSWRPLFPIPRDLVVETTEGGVVEGWDVLAPAREPDRVSHDLGDDVRLLGGTGDPLDGWWGRGTLEHYLRHREPEENPAGMPVADVAADEPPPWRVERRVGLARDGDRTAAEGLLYSVEHLRPDDEVGLAAYCVRAPDTRPADTVWLGGEGRRAEVRTLEPSALALPERPSRFPGGRMLLYLATPAVFRNGWLPTLDGDEHHGARVVAAAVGEAEVVATAVPDRRDGSVSGARLRWAVPAGSVYFLEFPGRDDSAVEEIAETWHGTALPAPGGATEEERRLRTAGFGLVLTGTWNWREEKTGGT